MTNDNITELNTRRSKPRDTDDKAKFRIVETEYGYLAERRHSPALWKSIEVSGPRVEWGEKGDRGRVYRSVEDAADVIHRYIRLFNGPVTVAAFTEEGKII